MSEEEQKQAELEAQKKAQLEAEKKSLEGKSNQELLDIIFETRNEAKQRRLDNKKIQEELEQIKSKQNEAEQQKKIAEGKKDEVIKELSDKLTIAEKKAKEFDSYEGKRREQLKVVIGEDNWLNSYDKIVPLEELEILASKFNGKSLEDTDVNRKKIPHTTKLDALYKDLGIAVERKNLQDQIAIKRLIEEEKAKK